MTVSEPNPSNIVSYLDAFMGQELSLEDAKIKKIAKTLKDFSGRDETIPLTEVDLMFYEGIKALQKNQKKLEKRAKESKQIMDELHTRDKNAPCSDQRFP